MYIYMYHHIIYIILTYQYINSINYINTVKL